MENKLDTSFSCKAGAKLKMHGHTVYSLRKEENQESQPANERNESQSREFKYSCLRFKYSNGINNNFRK